MSLRTALQRTATLAQRRFVSTTTAAPKSPYPEGLNSYTVKKAFFSDPSTYPLIAIMCTAATFIVGMSINALRYKNVNINPAHRHDTVVTDGTEKRTTVTEIVARKPVGFHRKGFYDIRHEGLGVNHEEWVKAKKQEK